MHSTQSHPWEPAYSTKGMSLTLTEARRQKDQNEVTGITYSVNTAGVPQDQTYTLLVKNFLDDSPGQLGEIRIDGSGKLLDKKISQLFDPFTATQVVMGQPLTVAFINSDKSKRVYAKVLPFPI